MKRGNVIVCGALLVVGLGATACGTDPATETVVCSDFRVGADMTQASFGVSGSLAVSYVAFAQAAGDVATVSATLFHDVGAACDALARDLGQDLGPDPVGESDLDHVTRVCGVAADRVAAARAKLGKVSLHVVPAICATDAAYQGECEARCQKDVSCKEAAAAERCAPEDREGVCSGVCTGTCEGGQELDLHGSTRDLPRDRCDTRCLGGCSEPLTDPTCTGALAPPRCAGDVDCQASCSASAVARGRCTEGAVTVSVEGGADDGAAVVVATFERNLPVLMTAARGRAQLLHDGASSLVDAAGHVLLRGDELGKQGAACGLIIGRTGEAASRNLETALAGAKAVTAAVDGK